MMLRFATYLAPILYDTYQSIARYIGEQVGAATTLVVGQSLHDFAVGKVDVGFTCGLPYALMVATYAKRDAPACPIELLAAPVLLGERYRGRPIYFSDVVVRSDSPYASFDDLQGCRWAYNQPESHSGWNLVCYNLLKRGKTPAFFGQLIQSGSHQRSLEMVLAGEANAAAIDSHVLDVFLARDKEAAASLRVIDMFGPSSIPPIVVAIALDLALKRRVQDALLAMHEDPCAAGVLHEGAIARFARVRDGEYDDLREMHRVAKGNVGAQFIAPSSQADARHGGRNELRPYISPFNQV
ncbi:MAG TPA: PhnD/SsuA/transferrin family substrate-binding protein [Ktedonobacteraceae bacterium]|nr:PhnD/SsuA/transferrin family substrate-binding protein [Ktedonobacteraceae bacterium]